MKLALVHDYFREWGGAEEVVKALHEIWVEAPIYTSYVTDNFVVDQPSETAQDLSKPRQAGDLVLASASIKTSWMQNIPESMRSWNGLTPLLPFAFGSFDFSDYDVVISSSAAFAKTISVKKPTVHICYCHTPPRFLYGLARERKDATRLDMLEAPFKWWLKHIDQASAGGVQHFIANSHVVAERIKRIYDRDATVIYPPVDIDKFSTSDERRETSEYFVIFGRLSPIKHFEIAVEACTKANIPLKVIGTGIAEKQLRSIAGPSVEFLGRVDDQTVAQIIAGSKAVINTILDEDFGIVPLEVLGAGKPVIAYASEAAKETMIDGVTGQFYFESNAHVLATLLANFDTTRYDPSTLRKHAEKYAKSRFMEEMRAFVEEIYAGTSRS